MKRYFWTVLAACAGLFGCQVEKMAEYVPLGDDEFHATIENDGLTRTILDEHNNVRWSENDQIVIFNKSTLSSKYQVDNASVGKTSASFRSISSGNSDGGFNSGMSLEHNIAFYPYSDAVECEMYGEDYKLTVNLPSEQTFAPESFGNNTFPMVAVSETNNITFRNICGGLKLQLKGTCMITSIKVEGKNGEKLSGNASVIAYTDDTKPTITMDDNASTLVTLNCGTGVQLNENTATEFIIVLPPVLFGNGFTVTIIDTENNNYTLETNKANTVIRSSLLTMPTVLLENSDTLTVPEDPNPESTSFAHRMLLIDHTGTGCLFCPILLEILKNIADDEAYNSRYHLVASHSYNDNDPAYCSAASSLSRTLGINAYPSLTFNLSQKSVPYNDKQAIKTSIDELSKDVADAGISAISKIEDNVIKVKAEIKASIENTYRIAVWLLEDDIYCLQSGATASWQNTHNNALRAMVGESRTEQVYGLKVGTLQSGAKASMECEITLNKSWDADNCKLLIIASSSDGSGNYDVANCAVVPIGESLAYKYN